MKYRVVTLKADGIEERQVIYVHYELNQQTDIEGQPVGRTRGGKITLRVKTPKNGNTDIIEWMCNSYVSKNGVIIIPALGGGDQKRIEFFDGFVVEYAETFDQRKELVFFEEFTITAKKIRVGNATHDNEWTIDSPNNTLLGGLI